MIKGFSMETVAVKDMIYEIRGRRVMLDFELAGLYEVETRVLKQAVRRNIERFPEDFMFEVSIEELNLLKVSLRSQFVILKGGQGNHIKYSSLAFTEQGVAMLSSVLRSERAIKANISIMRAFVSVRNYVAGLSVLTAELAEIRNKLELMERNDEENMEAINDLSEETRKEMDNLYLAFAALAAKAPQLQKPRAVVKGYSGHIEENK